MQVMSYVGAKCSAMRMVHHKLKSDIVCICSIDLKMYKIVKCVAGGTKSNTTTYVTPVLLHIKTCGFQ